MLTKILAVLLSTAPGASVVELAPTTDDVWLTTGHAVVCEIAWRELTPAARAGIDRLLVADPQFEAFAPSCDWPDLIRDIREYDRYVPAHDVFIPPGAGGVDVARDCGPELCAVDGIEEFARRLRASETSIADRLVALKYLGHIVADLHQPLHAGFESDHGGRDVETCLPDGTRQNLHWVWDSWLVDARLEARGADWRAYAAFLHENISAVERELWASRDPRDWADESFALMQDEVYDGVGDACLTRDYATRNASTIERRLKQAGLRLGALLNEIFG